MRSKKIISLALAGSFLVSGIASASSLKLEPNFHSEELDKGIVPIVLAAPQNNTMFTDVSDHSALKDILAINERGIMLGFGNGKFEPEKLTTKAELAVTLDRLFDFNFAAVTFIKAPSLSDLFDDVYDEKWYSENLLEISFFGVFNTEDREFNPEQPITRIELARAITKSFEAKKLSVITTKMFVSYPDVEEEDSNVVNFLFNTGIMKGVADGKFEPNKTVTRAELAIILNKTAETLKYAEPINNAINEENSPLAEDLN